MYGVMAVFSAASNDDLARTRCDGIIVQIVIGGIFKGDFTPEKIIPLFFVLPVLSPVLFKALLFEQFIQQFLRGHKLRLLLFPDHFYILHDCTIP